MLSGNEVNYINTEDQITININISKYNKKDQDYSEFTRTNTTGTKASDMKNIKLGYICRYENEL